MGISPREFWNLTWYEWGFYALKLHDQGKRQQHTEDMFLGVTRLMIADFRNAHRGNSPAIDPKDIFRLSFETKVVVEEERPLTFPELKALYGSRFKRDGG